MAKKKSTSKSEQKRLNVLCAEIESKPIRLADPNDDSKLEQPFVRGVQCPRCKDRLWSRFGHDFHHCKCQYLFVDGGRHYLRFGWGDPFSGEGTFGTPTQIIIDTSNPANYDD